LLGALIDPVGHFAYCQPNSGGDIPDRYFSAMGNVDHVRHHLVEERDMRSSGFELRGGLDA
jgi:hypothetical protein